MIEEKFNIIQEQKSENVVIQVLEVKKLEGATNLQSAMQLFYTTQTGASMKMIKIILKGGSVKTESGALYYMKGKIESDAQLGGAVGVLGKMIKSSMNKETAIKPVYKGYGEVYLEPTFQHYFMINLTDDSVIVDKGLFYCCSGNMKVEAFVQKNVSSAFMGGEGFFQTKISGTGVVVLAIPVPENELQEIVLSNGEELKVDGNFALARTAGVNFSVTKSDKSIFGSLMNGEGLLQTFRGEGIIWIAPTAPVYEKMMFGTEVLGHNHKSGNNKE
ncbi:MAG: AIM24 family protein [Clostridiaceae bacterium]|nr:AIM24 family protein [Clostridiaceae bacterium]